MAKGLAAVCAFILGSAQVLAAQDLGSLGGVVRDSTGALLVGADVALENKRKLTSPDGSFRFDSVEVGTHLIVIRMIGYSPLRSPVRVLRETSYYTFVLQRAAYVLPTVTTESRRTGIYGTVGDSSLKPLASVKVQLAGRREGETLTDSGGRFVFPAAAAGQYVVRAIHTGYAEARLFIELKKDEGAQLAIRLRPSRDPDSRVDEVAIHDVGRRIAANLASDRLNTGELNRYGSLSLCEVNRIAASLARGQADSLTIIVNGTFVIEKGSFRNLCAWRASEIELVEFGESICRDVTRTLVDMLNVWCWNETGKERGVLKVRASRVKSQRQGGPFVVIWEKR